MRYPQHLLKGALLVLLAELCMASMGALIKHLGQSLPNEMLVFSRSFLGLLFFLPLLATWRNISFKTRVLKIHLVRSLSGISAMYCFFYALIHLPLADGMLLKMTAPLFMPLIAGYWLKEGISRYSFYALIIGFLGVLIVLHPGGDFNFVMLIGVLGGFFAAVAKVSIRRLSRTEPIYRTVFYFSLVGFLVSVIPVSIRYYLEPFSLNQTQILLLLAAAAVGTAGQFALTRGYAIANAGTIAPFTYFSVIFGSLYGYFFWQEIPAVSFFAGALLIALAGLLTMKKPVQKVTGGVL